MKFMVKTFKKLWQINKENCPFKWSKCAEVDSIGWQADPNIYGTLTKMIF